MLSYRHAFHAGNYADVLKHLILREILLYYREKNPDFVYFDTHAGTGLYDLSSKEALHNREYDTGIKRLFLAENLSPVLADFVAQLKSACPENHYWGSAFWAGQLWQSPMKIRLFERHPRDYERLTENMKPFRLGRHLKISDGDGLSGLIGQLPPTPRRAVILIDPSYEQKTEYSAILNTLKEAKKRFSTGCYVIWYPILQKLECQEFIRKLHHQYADNFYYAELHIKAPSQDGYGMHASGMFVINPPYTLPERINPVLPELSALLGQDNHAKALSGQQIK